MKINTKHAPTVYLVEAEHPALAVTCRKVAIHATREGAESVALAWAGKILTEHGRKAPRTWVEAATAIAALRERPRTADCYVEITETLLCK